MPDETGRAFAWLFALGLFCLPGAVPAGAAATAGPSAPEAGAAALLHPVHDTLGEAVPDEETAYRLAHHMIEDLVQEKTIDAAWRDARPVKAERKRLTRRSPFEVWIVRFLAAGDVDGQGTDLFIMVSGEGEFLKYSYQAP